MTAATLTRRFVVLRGVRWLPLGMLLPFIVLMPQARGLGIATIGALWALHSVVVLLLEVPSGALADALGRRRVLLAGAALMAVAMLGYAFAEAPVAFALSLAALATGRAFTSGALEAWYVDELRGLDPAATLTRGLSRGTVADSVGIGAGALMGGFLPLAFGGMPHSGSGMIFYSPVALMAAGAAVAYLIAVLALVVERRPPPSGAPLSARVAEVRRTAVENVRASHTVRTLLTTAAAFGVALSSVEILWQPRLAGLLGDAEDHTVLFGVLVATAMATVAAGAACTPTVVRVLGARRGYTAVMAVSALAFVALALAGAPFALVVAYLALHVTLGVGDPIHYELLHHATADDCRATVLSADSLTMQGGAAVGNLGLAAVAAAAGIPVAWLLAAGVLGLAGLLTLRLAPAEAPAPAAVPTRAAS